ncbi:MAG: DNA polymerase III subunit beta [Elusimicrobia bacterium RIFCSPLOWO2_01_FULL_54_10]|nr:MAG: DNA polymerase III subunit beta [Elusimicrobia bacterium RIFCSPLOWO2_01_FULL_54_10]
MKLSFNKSDLQTAIQTVQASVPSKSTLPILSNILIRVTKAVKGAGQKVWLEATDLEVGIRASVKAEILSDGKITIPGKKFGDLVREMPEGSEIEISSADGKRVDFKCGKVKAGLMSLPPDDFPTIPEFPAGKCLELDRSVFREMLKKTSFAVSTDETRYVLNGIFFGAAGGELKTVATDGRRLAFISRPGAEESISANVIIPSKAISELLRLLGQDESAGSIVKIAPFENQISFQWASGIEEIVLVSRVIDGTFPNYDQVIPKSKEIELTVKTQDILSAIKRSALFAQDRGGSVKFSLSKGALKVSANAHGLGEEEEELEVNYKGPDFEIAFNPQFLLDSLKNNDAPEVRFEFSTALNPGLIKPSDSDRYLCVIMPMRLQ